MRKYLLIIFTVLLCLTGCARTSDAVLLEDISSPEGDMPGACEASSNEPAVDEAEGTSSKEIHTAVIVVYVCGAVLSPGVYELPEDSRINDAVIAAGGFSSEADMTYVNLAAPLVDGMKLKIPTTSETASAGIQADNLSGAASLPETYDAVKADSGMQDSDPAGLININTASREQLMTLPGVGDKVAGRIIEYRDSNGPFRKTEDIMKISGIKEKLFSRIRDKITV